MTNPITAERRAATTAWAGGEIRDTEARKKETDTAISPTPAQSDVLEYFLAILSFTFPGAERIKLLAAKATQPQSNRIRDLTMSCPWTT